MSRGAGGNGHPGGYVRATIVPGWLVFLLLLLAPLLLLVLASLAAAAIAFGALLALPLLWRRPSRRADGDACIELDPTDYRRIDPEPPPRLRDG